MRKTASWLVALLLGAGIFTAPPALAAYAVIVGLPASTFYSPYDGPATVTFTFAPADSATIFTVRLRQAGGGTIKEKDYLVDPATQTSPHDVSFSWSELSVTASTDYVVDVRRQDGGGVITNATFTLLPRLVSDLSAKPSPFYPLVQDGYKDVTKIGYSLAADTTDTVAHVYAPDAYGRCCGAEIRTVDVGPLAAGAHRWTWDGRKNDASFPARGIYYVRFGATDTNAYSTVSKAQTVEIAKGWIRLTASKQKQGSAYARTGDFQQTAMGGLCFVSRNRTNKTADILCANADISVFWKWGLKPGQRVESESFKIDGGYYGCHRKVGHTKTQSFLRATTPPTSECAVITAKITYSYRVQA